MPNRYAIGAKRENDLVAWYENRGWWAARSPGSKGAVDVVGIAPELAEIHFVQLKAYSGSTSTWSGFGPKERARLRADAYKAGATPLYCVWPVSGEMRWYPEDQWPSDKTGPDYHVDERTGCWVWAKYLSPAGYGELSRDGHKRAHRWYYEKHVGPIPDGLVLDHVCSNRACVNPEHLEPVTDAENVRRGGRAKLTPEQVVEIRASSRSQSDLARIYGVAPSTVSRIRKGGTWKDVEPDEPTFGNLRPEQIRMALAARA